MTNKEKTHYKNDAYKSLFLKYHFCDAYLKALLIHKTYTYIHTYIYMNWKLIFYVSYMSLEIHIKRNKYFINITYFTTL